MILFKRLQLTLGRGGRGVVTLNVGGRLFTTRVETLTRERESLLAGAAALDGCCYYHYHYNYNYNYYNYLASRGGWRPSRGSGSRCWRVRQRWIAFVVVTIVIIIIIVIIVIINIIIISASRRAAGGVPHAG
jgi:hypothetical protein